ncbi:MmgE/PrpD family protein [Pigmentiphaga soli]|uniref:MmgE/PrpD family protein n=1 Tax=Pigmentiphaga soli TaxID=1007095 RepID=A0ABP8HQS3_9BURK
MGTASQTLAAYAAGLQWQDLPEDVRERARACIIDTLACITFGARFPWSAATAAYARRYGAAGPCTVFGVPDTAVMAPAAALANGAAAHAFEQDSLRSPGAGVHPGATLVPAVVAACQDAGADGATALRAFVAACEVMFRIGAAGHHTSEKLGFHAPGLLGPYGATVAAGVVYGLDADRLASALGIAGSLSSGLLAFTKARQGAMVKRLHMGRACEAGILAARLAADGYTGPETILEGRFGFLDVYCRDGDPELLTAGLGRDWETRRVCMKRYPCHVTAQPAIQALRQLMGEHGFTGRDVAQLSLEVPDKVASHHDIRAPGDVMSAQYSLPFSVALALCRDPEDPNSFDEEALSDPDILRLCGLIRLAAAQDLPSSWSARIEVVLRDGRTLQTLASSFRGMPQDPFGGEDLRRRFLLMTGQALGEDAARAWYEALAQLQVQPAFPVPAFPAKGRAKWLAAVKEGGAPERS